MSSPVPDGLSVEPPGDDDYVDEERVEPKPPTRGERAAFRLLPLVWIGVAILAGVILYAVFT